MNAKPTAYPILEHKHSNGDARNRTEGNIGEKNTYLSPPTSPKAQEIKMKNIRSHQSSLPLLLTILFYHLKVSILFNLFTSFRNIFKCSPPDIVDCPSTTSQFVLYLTPRQAINKE